MKPSNPHWQALQEATAAQSASARTGDREPSQDTATAGNERPQAPQETGRRLATFARPGYGKKPAQELRVTVDNFNGNDYLGARVWERGQGGHWYPTANGISIRRGEILGFIKAIVAGSRELGIGGDHA